MAMQSLTRAVTAPNPGSSRRLMPKAVKDTPKSTVPGSTSFLL